MKECKIKNGIFQIYEFPNKGDKFPTIIMLHGFTGNHLEPSFLFARFSKIAAEEGFATVRFDFKGSGNSDGEFYEMTSKTELQDTLEMLKIVKNDKRFDKNNLFILGLSMGGTIALRTVGRKPEDFKGCILWSAASFNKEVFSKGFSESKDKMIKTPNGYDLGGIEISEEFIKEISSYNAVEEAKIFKGPYLLVHGSNDPTVPVEVSKKASKILPNSKLKIVDNADHTYRRISWSNELFDSTLEFLKETVR